jgi:hypothetical protein
LLLARGKLPLVLGRAGDAVVARGEDVVEPRPLAVLGLHRCSKVEMARPCPIAAKLASAAAERGSAGFVYRSVAETVTGKELGPDRQLQSQVCAFSNPCILKYARFARYRPASVVPPAIKARTNASIQTTVEILDKPTAHALDLPPKGIYFAVQPAPFLEDMGGRG